MITIQKFEDFDSSVNEMAFKNPETGKAWVIGDIFKISALDKDSVEFKNTEIRSKANRYGDTKFKKNVVLPSPLDLGTTADADKTTGLCFIEVTENSTKYIKGKVLFTNCGWNSPQDVRMHGQHIETPGKIWDYIEAKLKDIEAHAQKGKFFNGDEGIFMDKDGDEITIKPDTYIFNGFNINFKLTEKFKEPVLSYCVKGAKTPVYYVKLSDVDTASAELSTEQTATVAAWIMDNSDLTVEANGGKFSVRKVFFKGRTFQDSTFSMGPFISIQQSNLVKKALETEKMVFADFKDAESKLGESHEIYEFSFPQMVDFMKSSGIDMNIRAILKDNASEVDFREMGI